MNTVMIGVGDFTRPWHTFQKHITGERDNFHGRIRTIGKCEGQEQARNGVPELA